MHPTLLPRHRGRAPIPVAILSGASRRRGRDLVRDHRSHRQTSGPIVVQVRGGPIAHDETADDALRPAGKRRHVRLRAPTRFASDRGRRSEPRIPPGREGRAGGLVGPSGNAALDGIHRLGGTRAPYLYDWVSGARRRAVPGRPSPGSTTEKGGGLARLPVEVRERSAGRLNDSSSGEADRAWSWHCGDGRAPCWAEVETQGDLEVWERVLG